MVDVRWRNGDARSNDGGPNNEGLRLEPLVLVSAGSVLDCGDYPRGSPSPRVAMIPRWISLVPAATVPETACR